MGLIVAVEFSAGHMIYIADNESVMIGWHQQRFDRPQGDSADLWSRLGKLRTSRDFDQVTVLQVSSHQSARELADSSLSWMALGNEAADEMAGLAATEARVPASFRHKVARSEQMA
eukprot:6737093-Pyramimonas_sp.AAC.1